MAWDVSERLLSLEAVLVMAILMFFEYWVKCGNEFVRMFGNCSQVAPDQVYEKTMSEDQFMQVMLDAFANDAGASIFAISSVASMLS